MLDDGIKRRNVAVAVSLVVLAVFGFLGFSCSNISTWATALLVIGLLFDGAGALIIVGPELSNLEKFWQDEQKAQLRTNLQQGRNTLFANDSLSPSETGFKQVSETIISRTTQTSVPNKITIGGRLGGGNQVAFVHSNNNDDIGAPQIVDEWLSERIDRLQQQARERMISDGAKVLAVGFTLQLIAVVIQRVGVVRELLLALSPC
jgi:hypothetical protein